MHLNQLQTPVLLLGTAEELATDRVKISTIYGRCSLSMRT